MELKSIWNQLFINDIDYTIKVSELIYYWIISIGLLWLAYKTYINSIKQEALLAVQLQYDLNNFDDNNIQVEIYNYGNYVAKNIYLDCQNTNIFKDDNSLFNNDIGFIRPGSYKKIQVGYILGDKISFLGEEMNKEEFLKEDIKITVKYNDNKHEEYILNTSYLKNLQSVKLGSSDYTKEISKSLKSMDTSIKSINKELKRNSTIQ